MKSMLGVVLVAGMLAVAPHAGAVTYITTLSGASEAPPNSSGGAGTSTVVLNTAAHTLRVIFDFTGLDGLSTVAHIHGPTVLPGVSTASVMTMVPSFAGFPEGVTSGSYDTTFNTLLDSTYNPAFLINSGGSVAGAEATLAAALAEGRAYLNIHSDLYPGGEIRGFYVPVPLPAAVGPLLLGLLGLAALKRAARRRPV